MAKFNHYLVFKINNNKNNPLIKIVAPFVGVINIKSDQLKTKKLEFKKRVDEKSIPINTHYIQIAPLWEFLDNYISDKNLINKSKKWSNNHLILYLHEGYKNNYIKNIVKQLADIFKEMNL